ncbi:MAG: hypothetical protein IH611_11070, partial [Deltaproteobacteria bacterium]|nr:hypothetical protein [Deltaproteobacteria bacterium]
MRRPLILLLMLSLFAPVAFFGCSGDDGSTGATGPAGPPGAPGDPATSAIASESCATCHAGEGDAHQTAYDELYQDNVVQVTNVAYSNDGTSDIVTFDLAGPVEDCSQLANLNIYFVGYTGTGFDNDNGARVSLKGTLTNNAGQCTSTNAQTAAGDLSAVNGLLVVYGYHPSASTIPNTRVRMAKYPYAAILKTGTVGHVPTANVAGCEKCHTVPYLKHGNIYGRVAKDASTDFLTCKACHQDNAAGGHYEWQLLVENPAMAAEYLTRAEVDEDAAVAWLQTQLGADFAKYEYKMSVMEDTHRSHAMEFAYPQSASNCIACHEGKLANILTDANFTLATCKSCHPVTGSNPLALETLIDAHGVANVTTPCNDCHKTGSIAPVFGAIHSGYDKRVYTSAGAKYSDAITVTIDSATFVNNQLTIQFHAAESPDIAGLNVTSIVPTVMVGLYGWDTKDFLFGPHERTIDSDRNIEYVVGSTHPRFTTVSASGGTWRVTADLSTWAADIANGSVKRVEIGVLPKLVNSDNVVLALTSPSRTFDLTTKAFVNYYAPIADVAKCNNCHEALGTTFH